MSNPYEGSGESKEPPVNAATNPLRESHLRSVLKALSWRVLATTTTGFIAYFLLVASSEGDSSKAAQQAVAIAAVEFVVKIFIYYLHERAWQCVPRGAIRKIFRPSR